MVVISSDGDTAAAEFWRYYESLNECVIAQVQTRSSLSSELPSRRDHLQRYEMLAVGSASERS
jgi:hypothetical protein